MKPQKKTVFGPIKTDLKEGDPYVDIPVYKPVPVLVGKQPMQGQATAYYVRQPLIWKNRLPASPLQPRHADGVGYEDHEQNGPAQEDSYQKSDAGEQDQHDE